LNEHSASGLSRRSLLTGGAAAAAGAALAGCANTTTPIPVAGAQGDGKGLLGDPTAGGPVDAFGIPLARRDYPVTLPRTKKPVAADAEPERGGELQVYNYADYLNPRVLKEFGRREGVSVRVTTFNTLDEAFSKLASGLKFDVIFSAPDQLSKLVGAGHVAPLELGLIPNLEANVWPELHSPPYDVGSRYSVPYTTYGTGIGWRNDKIGDIDVDALGWDAFWAAEDYRGRVSILDDEREAIGMALMRQGELDLNTEDPAKIDRAGRELGELRDRVGVKITINGYEAVPTARTWMAQVWSGDMVNAIISYLPKGTPPTVMSYWTQEDGGPIFNDIALVAAEAAKPVMAHRFLNYLLDNDVAYDNFIGYVGYQPPITAIDPNALLERDIIPPELRNVLLTREDYAAGNAYLGLTAKGDQLWDSTFAELKSG
jgi:spermidine/putrescine transport system substrate-binding protein